MTTPNGIAKVRVALTGLLLALASIQCHGYGAAGHALIGALGEARLSAESAKAYGEVRKLLGNVSMEEAAMIPDEIRVWDKLPGPERALANVKDIKSTPGKAVGVRWNNEALRQAVWEYWKKNSGIVPGDGQQYHHVYHFTDIAVGPGAALEYRYDGKVVGQNEYDIVHTLVACFDVLHTAKADTARGITPQLAVILICHLMGDLHQPLHVGAEYFVAGTATAVNPNGMAAKTFTPDKGGNGISVPIDETPANAASKHTVRVIAGASEDNLHSVWDKDAVEVAFEKLGVPIPSAKKAAFITQIAKSYKLAPVVPAKNAQPKDYFSAWAQEILPNARLAHEKLKFEVDMVTGKNGQPRKVIEVADLPQNDTYLEWAGQVVAEEIPKAGARLAWVLQQAVAK